MEIESKSLRTMMKKRYPNARVYALDTLYDVPTLQMLEKAYKKFQRSLWAHKLIKWLRNQFDCDDFAWSFKASCAIGNALSKNVNANPVGFICYFEGGDREKGHAINNAVIGEGEVKKVVEVESQPKAGVKELTQAERHSTWLVII